MATATTCPEDVIGQELKAALSGKQDILSVYMLPTDNVLSVWVGIRNDSPQARRYVYELEDKLAVRYREVLFEVRVVPVPKGRKMGDFISGAHLIFERAA